MDVCNETTCTTIYSGPTNLMLFAAILTIIAAVVAVGFLMAAAKEEQR